MLLRDEVTHKEVGKDEIREIFDHKNIWSGYSDEFKDIFYRYTITKSDSNYCVEVKGLRKILLSPENSSFEEAFLALEILKYAQDKITALCCPPPSKPPLPDMVDANTREIMTFQNIRTILINENRWCGEMEWSPGAFSGILMSKKDDGYEVSVYFKGVAFAATGLQKMDDAFSILSQYNETIARIGK